MIYIRSDGTCRFVVCVDGLAFKLAKGEKGRRCNAYEADTWEHANKRRRSFLCPMLGICFGSQLLIMQRAVPLTDEEARELEARNELPDWGYDPNDHRETPFEMVAKGSDWGRIEGRLVSLDYSAPAVAAKSTP